MYMDLEVRHLRLVAAVADVGSLTRAGDRLHLTQSALSHQLRDIESRLGAALFLRVGKRLVLTPAGERLLASATRRARAAASRPNTTSARWAATARACCASPPSATPAITGCRRCCCATGARFPRVEVRIDVEATHQPDRDAAGRQDRSRASMSTPVRDRRLVVAPRVRRRAGADRVAAPPLRAADARPRSPQMRDETLFIYPPKEESGPLQKCCCRRARAPARVEEVQLTEAITELVKAGLGVAILARWAVQPLIDAGAHRRRARCPRAACTACGAR